MIALGMVGAAALHALFAGSAVAGPSQAARADVQLNAPQGDAELSAHGADPILVTLPATVSLTNAGGAAAKWFVRDEAALARARAAGDAGDMIRAGATPLEVGEMLRATCGDPAGLPCQLAPLAGTERWSSSPDGAIQIAAAIGSLPGGSREAMVTIRRFDMAGIAAPPDVIERDRQNRLRAEAMAPPELRGATAVLEGGQGSRITGYRLTSGEVISVEDYLQRRRAGITR